MNETESTMFEKTEDWHNVNNQVKEAIRDVEKVSMQALANCFMSGASRIDIIDNNHIYVGMDKYTLSIKVVVEIVEQTKETSN